MTRLIIYASLLGLLLGAAWAIDNRGYQRAVAECAAEKGAEAAEAANAVTGAVKDAAAENQANAEAIHVAGDQASIAAAEEVARLRRELDQTRRQLKEAYRDDATADHWRHERLPDSVRRLLESSRNEAGSGAG